MASGSLTIIADYEDADTDTDDNINPDHKIQGAHLRGTFTVSQDGRCPRCETSDVLFVILDELFPMGDMPEILHTLIARGKAVLWSSQDREGCQAPPSFLCRGFCPSDPLGAGFNVNWDKVSLESMFLSHGHIHKESSGNFDPNDIKLTDTSNLQDPWLVLDEVRKSQSSSLEPQSSSELTTDEGEEDKVDDEDSDNDDEDDIDEEELIRQMLAKEEAKHEAEKLDFQPSEELKTSVEYSQPSSKQPPSRQPSPKQPSSKQPKTSSSSDDTHQYPVSSDGRCPHCKSKNVKYIVVCTAGTRDVDMPYTLRELLRRQQAFKMAKGTNEPPSFQCQSCQYGFNLDWSSTNLERIYAIPNEGNMPESTQPQISSAATVTTNQSPVGYQRYTATPMMMPRHATPPHGISKAGVPPPGLRGMAPPGLSPPGVPPLGFPPGVRPPGVPPPAVPPLGVPPCLPPPGVPPPVTPPGVPPLAKPPLGVPPPGVQPSRVQPSRVPPPAVPPPTVYSSPRIPPPMVPPPTAIPPPTHPRVGSPRYPPPSGVSPRYPPSPAATHQTTSSMPPKIGLLGHTPSYKTSTGTEQAYQSAAVPPTSTGIQQTYPPSVGVPTSYQSPSSVPSTYSQAAASQTYPSSVGVQQGYKHPGAQYAYQPGMPPAYPHATGAPPRYPPPSGVPPRYPTPPAYPQGRVPYRQSSPNPGYGPGYQQSCGAMPPGYPPTAYQGYQGYTNYNNFGYTPAAPPIPPPPFSQTGYPFPPPGMPAAPARFPPPTPPHGNQFFPPPPAPMTRQWSTTYPGSTMQRPQPPRSIGFKGHSRPSRPPRALVTLPASVTEATTVVDSTAKGSVTKEDQDNNRQGTTAGATGESKTSEDTQTAEDENEQAKQDADRFEKILNRIDQAREEVWDEGEQVKEFLKELKRQQENDEEGQNEPEPNSLSEEQDVDNYDEGPPGVDTASTFYSSSPTEGKSSSAADGEAMEVTPLLESADVCKGTLSEGQRNESNDGESVEVTPLLESADVGKVTLSEDQRNESNDGEAMEVTPLLESADVCKGTLSQDQRNESIDLEPSEKLDSKSPDSDETTFVMPSQLVTELKGESDKTEGEGVSDNDAVVIPVRRGPRKAARGLGRRRRGTGTRKTAVTRTSPKGSEINKKTGAAGETGESNSVSQPEEFSQSTVTETSEGQVESSDTLSTSQTEYIETSKVKSSPGHLVRGSKRKGPRLPDQDVNEPSGWSTRASKTMRLSSGEDAVSGLGNLDESLPFSEVEAEEMGVEAPVSTRRGGRSRKGKTTAAKKSKDNDDLQSSPGGEGEAVDMEVEAVTVSRRGGRSRKGKAAVKERKDSHEESAKQPSPDAEEEEMEVETVTKSRKEKAADSNKDRDNDDDGQQVTSAVPANEMEVPSALEKRRGRSRIGKMTAADKDIDEPLGEIEKGTESPSALRRSRPGKVLSRETAAIKETSSDMETDQEAETSGTLKSEGDRIIVEAQTLDRQVNPEKESERGPSVSKRGRRSRRKSSEKEGGSEEIEKGAESSAALRRVRPRKVYSGETAATKETSSDMDTDQEDETSGTVTSEGDLITVEAQTLHISPEKEKGKEAERDPSVSKRGRRSRRKSSEKEGGSEEIEKGAESSSALRRGRPRKVYSGETAATKETYDRDTDQEAETSGTVTSEGDLITVEAQTLQISPEKEKGKEAERDPSVSKRGRRSRRKSSEKEGGSEEREKGAESSSALRRGRPRKVYSGETAATKETSYDMDTDQEAETSGTVTSEGDLITVEAQTLQISPEKEKGKEAERYPSVSKRGRRSRRKSSEKEGGSEEIEKGAESSSTLRRVRPRKVYSGETAATKETSYDMDTDQEAETSGTVTSEGDLITVEAQTLQISPEKEKGKEAERDPSVSKRGRRSRRKSSEKEGGSEEIEKGAESSSTLRRVRPRKVYSVETAATKETSYDMDTDQEAETSGTVTSEGDLITVEAQTFQISPEKEKGKEAERDPSVSKRGRRSRRKSSEKEGGSEEIEKGAESSSALRRVRPRKVYSVETAATKETSSDMETDQEAETSGTVTSEGDIITVEAQTFQVSPEKKKGKAAERGPSVSKRGRRSRRKSSEKEGASEEDVEILTPDIGTEKPDVKPSPASRRGARAHKGKRPASGENVALTSSEAERENNLDAAVSPVGRRVGKFQKGKGCTTMVKSTLPSPDTEEDHVTDVVAPIVREKVGRSQKEKSVVSTDEPRSTSSETEQDHRVESMTYPPGRRATRSRKVSSGKDDTLQSTDVEAEQDEAEQTEVSISPVGRRAGRGRKGNAVTVKNDSSQSSEVDSLEKLQTATTKRASRSRKCSSKESSSNRSGQQSSDLDTLESGDNAELVKNDEDEEDSDIAEEHEITPPKAVRGRAARQVVEEPEKKTRIQRKRKK